MRFPLAYVLNHPDFNASSAYFRAYLKNPTVILAITTIFLIVVTSSNKHYLYPVLFFVSAFALVVFVFPNPLNFVYSSLGLSLMFG